MKHSMILISLLMNFMALSGQPLSKYEWKNRLILLFGPDLKDATVVKQMDRFQREAAALEDRDLLIYRISPGVVYGPEDQQEKNAAWFYEYYRVGKDEFNVILIGKDGGEKLRSEELIAPGKIFDLIDTMPMRRAEMRRKEKGNE